MSIFVHLTEERNKNKIIQNGIKTSKIHYENIPKGVFCMPVINDFYATHQWLREIKQYNSGNEIIAVYFRIPDDDEVYYGKYTEKMIMGLSKEAHKTFLSLEDKMGFQTIIERKISSKEIIRIKNLPQVIGWRHYPKSHERKRCLCPACLLKGSYKSTALKELEQESLFKELIKATDNDKIKSILWKIDDLGLRGEIGSKEEKLINEYLNSNDDGIRTAAINCLTTLYRGNYKDKFLEIIYGKDSIDVIETAIDSLIRIYNDTIVEEIDLSKCNEETIRLINEYKDLD
ncbi:hypothetical protein [Breznakiella homolactica]|uniref:HEAT repeat domain-containing protein n=1 Tax=Breznakiella homolactica TaxID=2798577 RepID=A0A7T7XQ00_9SPIR|nr:hypothetical protein [Breznakiella homolactica]QQO10360.1 hypothetical protein JFL75_05430 [Breznakiella homolactica]